MSTRRPPAPRLGAALLAAALLDVWVHVEPGDRIAMVCALLGAFSLVLRHRLPVLTYLLALPATPSPPARR
ncbi:hypothetical protein ACGFY9_36030 [Streptomyces sp. NPDC048504]|uniref:hypothetical protein n=1 Tax=Streptomyces sp. NPDC048504 TaxID=3365559 RepID=UPI00372055A3